MNRITLISPPWNWHVCFSSTVHSYPVIHCEKKLFSFNCSYSAFLFCLAPPDTKSLCPCCTLGRTMIMDHMSKPPACSDLLFSDTTWRTSTKEATVAVYVCKWFGQLVRWRNQPLFSIAMLSMVLKAFVGESSAGQSNRHTTLAEKKQWQTAVVQEATRTVWST